MTTQASTPLRRAVVYLRVSTAEQACRGGDREGFSIPAQRDACVRKAHDAGAEVVGEYIDAGQSARSADRPQLQAMLARIAADGDVDVVIVHKLDRLARNRADDIHISLALKTAGVTLVSCTESIDESPSGKLLHGIMASIAEFYSANLAREVVKGATQKAKAGGTPHKAPLGYRNVRTMIDGREVRTVTLDDQRAGLITWAFDAYATGEYSLRQLLAELTDRGLTNPATARWPERPLQLSKLAKLLHNPYYVGIVTYQAVQYEGSHDPLVTPDVFARVQEQLAAKHQSGERRRIHHHYLKGTVACGRCRGRLGLMKVTGNGGRYDYFFCYRRQRNAGCDLPYLPVDHVETVVAGHWAREQLTREQIGALRDYLLDELNIILDHSKADIAAQQTRLAGLERRRRRLVDAVLDGAVPADIAKEQQAHLQRQRLDAQTRLAHAQQASTQTRDVVAGGPKACRQLPPRLPTSQPHRAARMEPTVVHQRVS